MVSTMSYLFHVLTDKCSQFALVCGWIITSGCTAANNVELGTVLMSCISPKTNHSICSWTAWDTGICSTQSWVQLSCEVRLVKFDSETLAVQVCKENLSQKDTRVGKDSLQELLQTFVHHLQLNSGGTVVRMTYFCLVKGQYWIPM